MKSNYKSIGRYVRLVSLRNKDLAITDLKGINIDKQFMPSVANVTGTDLSKYKIVSQFQFAFNPMHVGRDEVLPISMLTSESPAIVSPAYTVFEIKNHQELLPEYLMMWCQRSEFDRNAWFTTDSSVRGGFSWEDFCEMPIPVPSIEKQKEIVREYNTIVERIKLNEQLCQKLEETAQALYKHWFVDFEFPISKEYAESIGKPELEGKPYKSSGGEMEFSDILKKDIPDSWCSFTIGALTDSNYANYDSKKDKFIEIQYLDTGNITNNSIDTIQVFKLGIDSVPSRAKRKVSHNDIIYSTIRPNLKHFGIIKNPPENMLVSTGFLVLKIISNQVTSELILLFLSSKEQIEYLHAKGEMAVTSYPSVKPEDILSMSIALPNDKSNLYVTRHLEFIFNKIIGKYNETNLLKKISQILLEKLSIIEQGH